jgi:hypothetical protein
MSVEYDFETIDISALATIEKVELLQMFAKMRTLGNRGLLVVMSGENNAHPDVTNNPRFANYAWIDTQDPQSPVLKLYAPLTSGSDQYTDWVNSALIDDSVTGNKIAQYAVSLYTLTGDKKIALRQDQTADATKASFLVRVDAAGQYIEVVSATAVVQGIQINLSQLAISGAQDTYVVTFDAASGVAKWAPLNVNTAIASGSLLYSKLVNAAAPNYGWLLRANPATGIIELVSNSDKAAVSDLLAIRSVRLNRLDDTGAVAYDKLRFDGTNWVKTTPFHGASTSGGTTIPSPNGGGQLLAPHGFGVVPRLIKAYAICNAADLNYAIGDKVDLAVLMAINNAGTEVAAATTIYADATNVVCNFIDTGGAAGRYRLLNDTTFARANIDPTKWDVYFYAEL